MADSKPQRRTLTVDEQRAASALKKLWKENQKRLNLTQEKMAKRYRTKDGATISQGAIGHYLTGRVPLNAWACRQFADALQVNVSDFAPISILKELEGLGDDSKLDDYFEISYYRRRFAAGTGANDGGEIEERLMFSRSWAAREDLPIDQLTAVDVSGDSMWPEICNGDTVVVRRDKTTVENGRIYAFDHGDYQRVKRVYRRGKSSLILVSDNPQKNSGPELISTGDLNDIKVIGLVILRIGNVA